VLFLALHQIIVSVLQQFMLLFRKHLTTKVVELH